MARCKKLIFILLLAAVTLGAVTPGIQSFNAGEVSPLLQARSDYAKYDNACLTLQNMLVLSQGPVTRRPGTKYIADVNNHSEKSRLIPFEFSKTDAYILEFEPLHMRLFRNGGQVLSGADPYDIDTVFEESELFEMQYVQSADVMYIVHPNHPPQKLSRTAHTAWTIADVNITTGPFLDENTTTTTITPSATTGTITLNASSVAMWTSDDVGALWRISHQKEETSLNGTLDANESSSTIACSDDYTFNIEGTWKGTVKLERSFDDEVTWSSVVIRYNNSAALNEDHPGSETDDDVTYRVTMTDRESGNATYNFSVHDYIQNGIVRITGYTDANTVTATVLSELGGTTATSKWAEGYWSDENGWPQTVQFHEERLCYGGSTDYPQTVWTSKTGDYENMTAGTLADDAIIYSLPGQNPIQWMVSQDYLFIGTLGGAGRLSGGGTDEPLSGESLPNYKNQVGYGSKNMQPVVAGDAVLYVERGGRKVREFVYNFERDGYAAPDLTLLAEHITESGIVDIAYQSRPDSILWCVTSDGVLLTMTYKREEDVIAWARQVTDGVVESVAVIPGDDEDEVWIVVARTIDGATKRYIEQLQPVDWGSDQADCFFVDSGLSFDGGDAVTITAITSASPAVVTMSTYPTDGDGDNLADGDQVEILAVGGMTELNGNVYTISDPNVSNKTFELRDSTDTVDINSVAYTTYDSGGTVQRVENTFSGLSHLEGETVAVMADGESHAEKVVVSGVISLDVWANKVHAGLPIISQLETMPIVFQTQTGTISSRIKRISEVTFDFYKTLGTEYGPDSSNVSPITFYTSDDELDEPVPLYSGFKRVPWIHGYKRPSTVFIQQTLALPMTIRAIIPEVEVYE